MKKEDSVRARRRLSVVLSAAVLLCAVRLAGCAKVEKPADAQTVPTAVEGADPALLALYADNAVIVDGYRQGIDRITGAFETKLVWLSGQEELCDLLLGRISGRANQALLDAYRVNEGIQNFILLDYDTVRPLLQPALQYDAFCEQATTQDVDVIELCLRNLYNGNQYVQQALADGTYTAEALEQDLTALIAREREKSCLAILYVYEPSLFPNQTVQSDAYQALLSARFCDEMFAYNLLVSYDTAVTLPEPAAYLNDGAPE